MLAGGGELVLAEGAGSTLSEHWTGSLFSHPTMAGPTVSHQYRGTWSKGFHLGTLFIMGYLSQSAIH